MGMQEYRANYRVAMQEANSHLAEIFHEFEELQLRKELLEDVLGALEAFLPSVAPMRYETPRPEPTRQEITVRQEPANLTPAAAVSAAIRESFTPAAFAPAAETADDPIQNRINRALGLAVA